ncbi:hypothetical protein [Photobacterium sp. GB-72]|uniref:AbiTii domain-containing protein n=1 Tax=Photobacterium sp. GB-72 TaxID=2022105 RepID=UPI000D172A01|nr:hypothetical protein [Photobacterium sp. GB-72]PSV30323.1 hypothetical protein C9J40_13650 [Photobacterium sp. GB-72]
MSLLRDIQTSVISDSPNLSSVLLKLRLLAARLNSDLLGDWISYEFSGYPKDVDVPDYRKVVVSFTGTFNGGFGSSITNAAIPTYLIEKFVGKGASTRIVDDGIGTIDDLVKHADNTGNGMINMDYSNYIMYLQGKVYPDYACNNISGSFARTSCVQIQNEVKSRILNFTIELEKAIPSAASITIEPKDSDRANDSEVSRIVYKTVYNISAGNNAKIGINHFQGNLDALTSEIKELGFSSEDAEELAKIVENEEPTSKEEPLGQRAKSWMADNLKKIGEGSSKVAVGVATTVITEAIKKYYGLG